MMNSNEKFIGPINLGNPHEISINELSNCISKLINSKSNIIIKKLPADDPVRRNLPLKLQLRNYFGNLL